MCPPWTGSQFPCSWCPINRRRTDCPCQIFVIDSLISSHQTRFGARNKTLTGTRLFTSFDKYTHCNTNKPDTSDLSLHSYHTDPCDPITLPPIIDTIQLLHTTHITNLTDQRTIQRRHEAHNLVFVTQVCQVGDAAVLRMDDGYAMCYGKEKRLIRCWRADVCVFNLVRRRPRSGGGRTYGGQASTSKLMYVLENIQKQQDQRRCSALTGPQRCGQRLVHVYTIDCVHEYETSFYKSNG